MFSGNLDFRGEEVFWLANPTPDRLMHYRTKEERATEAALISNLYA